MDVYAVSPEIADLNFSVAKLAMVDCRNHLFRERQRDIHANKLMIARIADPDM
jgi:hypothetical protein